MKTLPTMTVALFSAILLSGCATVYKNAYVEKLNTLNGKSVEEAKAVFTKGKTEIDPETGALHNYWENMIHVPRNCYNTTSRVRSGSRTLPNGQSTPTYKTVTRRHCNPATDVLHKCITTLTIQNDKIMNSKAEGNGCRPKQLDIPEEQE